MLFDNLINPQRPIETSTEAVRYSTQAMVERACPFADVVNRLAPLLSGSNAIAYNCDFDAGVMNQAAARKWPVVLEYLAAMK